MIKFFKRQVRNKISGCKVTHFAKKQSVRKNLSQNLFSKRLVLAYLFDGVKHLTATGLTSLTGEQAKNSVPS